MLPSLSLSKETQIPSGVPQGTILVLLLIIVTLLDIHTVTQSVAVPNCADNTSLSQVSKKPDDVANLPRDLNAIYKGAEENNVQVNAGKFQAPVISS